MNFASNVILKVALFFLALTLAGCNQQGHKGTHNHKGDMKHAYGIEKVNGDSGPKSINLIKMLSWTEPTVESCNADLQGRKPPATFTLRYTKKDGTKVLIQDDPEALMNDGWEFIHRTGRGYGFERAGEISSFNFDILEELQCVCGEKKESYPVKVDFSWESEKEISISAFIGEGKNRQELKPVIITGKGAVYEFTFSKPLPGGKGNCTSKFFALLNLSEPLE